ncbi:putative MFS-type transporter YfcJ [Actinomadura sp. RB99]|uniref:MFS transporter n=1 Tax=Actinomadura sp. RB99 TaxID=2691577 RepID=UPI00198DD9D3|nr:putative MFS-type transporter YfcJ [Actinomadura sp. RB99]
MLLSGLGCALQAHLDAGSGASSITLGLIVTGAGVGLMIPAMGAAVLTAAPPDRRGTAAGAMTTFRQLGQTLGVAALGVLFQNARPDTAAGLDHVYLAAALTSLTAAALAATALKRPGPTPSKTPGDKADLAG